jgi:hypothetical protein
MRVHNTVERAGAEHGWGRARRGMAKRSAEARASALGRCAQRRRWASAHGLGRRLGERAGSGGWAARAWGGGWASVR